MSATLTRFLGDSPLRVIIKLIVVSLLVGMVMNFFGWSPLGIVYWLRSFILDLWYMGFVTVESFLGYFLLGAAIVVPAFLILRLLSYRRQPR